MLHAIRRTLLFAVAFTIPMQTMGAFSVAGYPIGPNKTAAALLLLFAFLTWPLTRRGVPGNRKHLWVLLFAFSIMVGTLRSLFAGDTSPFGLLTLWSSYAAVFAFSFLLPYATTSLRDLHVFLGGLVLGGVATVVGGLIGAESFSGDDRFTGTEGNPNGLGGSLAMVLPVAFAFSFMSGSLLRKAFFLAATIISLAGIALSLSRAAIVSVAVMGLLWMIRFGRLDALRYLIPGLVLMSAMFFLAPESFHERVRTMQPGEVREDTSIEKRFLMNYWGVRAVVEHPVLGVGLAKAGEFANRYDSRIGPGHVIHHTFLQVGAELGLLGLIPILAVTFITWFDFSRVRRLGRARDLREDPTLQQLAWWATFLQIAFVAALIIAQFHPTTRDKGLWMLIGLSSALLSLARVRVRALRGTGEQAPTPPEPATFAWNPDLAREGPAR